jgi:hypothetical protein
MPDVQVTVADPLEGLWQGPVERALAAGRPTYLARPVMGVADQYALSSAGPMVQVLSERQERAPVLAYPVSELLDGSEIVLLGARLTVTAAGAEGVLYDLVPGASGETSVEAGSTLHVTLYWQARRSPQGDFSVQVRWVDTAGYAWLGMENRHPVGGTYPTSRWREGEIVADYYALYLPPALDPGEYQLQAALVLPGSSDAAWTTVASLGLEPAAMMPAQGTQVRKAFAGVLLTGYDAPQELVVGETATVALQWMACARSGQDREAPEHPRVWLVARDGTARAVAPMSGPTCASAAQQSACFVRLQYVEQYRFVVEDDLAALEVRGPAPETGVRALLGRGEARFRLPLAVASGAPPGTNFGNRMRLRDHTYEADSYDPGETVRITLEWEAIQTMDESYKVFVHVLGTNGLPVAQQDNEPLNGTYPTIRWQRGEWVSDPYAIVLPDHLAPGEYAVEVGLYRISDLTRLPVLDAEGQAVDDKLYLEPLRVE